MHKTCPAVEMQSQLWTLRIPFDILDIHLVLSVQLYKSEDTVYTHALTGGLGFSPRSEGFMHFGVDRSFLLSALASRSCAAVVDPPWPCYERERRRDEKQKSQARSARSGFSKLKRRVKSKELQRRERQPPLHPPPLFSLSLPDNRFHPRPFWLLSFLMGRGAGVYYLFFRICFLDYSYSPTHTGCLTPVLKGMVGGDGVGAVSQHSDVRFDVCFFSLYCYGRNCMLWIYKRQPHYTLDNRTMVFSKGSISNDWLGVCGNDMLVWQFKKKKGPPPFCIAPPA